jgi:hypothetical protein
MPKCALLLPRGHPLLLEDLTCFEGVKGSSEFLRGMRFAGAPIGHDDLRHTPSGGRSTQP